MKRTKRTDQSKKLISEALLELMEHFPYEEIAISTICEHSTVSRNTFYRNFSTKDSVLNYYLEKKCKTIIREFESNETYDPFSPTQEDLIRVYQRFYEYWYVNRDLVKKLLHCNLQNYLLSALTISVNNSYTEEWVNYFKEPYVADYYYSWIASSLYSILITWACHDFHLSAKEVATLTVQISSSINAHK